MKKISLGIIGAGNMGEAIIKGLLKTARFNVSLQEKEAVRAAFIKKKYKVRALPVPELLQESRAIILCVKPQDIDEVLLTIKEKIASRHLVISVAAGVTTVHIERVLGKRVAVVRVMPNMPGLIGEGISAYCLGKFAAGPCEKIVRLIFSCIGKVIKVEEKQMNAVTALSGSGPGFFSYLAEGFISAAQKQGLSSTIAINLCLETIKGTANLLTDPNLALSAQDLVKRVACKGGTTQAGLEAFEREKTYQIIEKAFKAALKRAKELSK